MDIEVAREFCLSLKGVTECFPFDDVSLVFKVETKMFALLSLDEQPSHISLKCDPDLALELRDTYNAVDAAWHFNKRYWNRVFLVGDMPDEKIKECIVHSYDEIIKKLPKKIRSSYSQDPVTSFCEGSRNEK